MLTTERKTHEALLRRKALRRGLTLTKSRRRDSGALDYDRYLLQPLTGSATGRWLTLDEVEDRLT
jgi:hypothetical protein